MGSTGYEMHRWSCVYITSSLVLQFFRCYACTRGKYEHHAKASSCISNCKTYLKLFHSRVYCILYALFYCLCVVAFWYCCLVAFFPLSLSLFFISTFGSLNCQKIVIEREFIDRIWSSIAFALWLWCACNPIQIICI